MNNVLEQAEPAIKGGISDVVSQGYCVGCGACSAQCGADQAVEVKFNSYGLYEPDLSQLTLGGDIEKDLSKVCPFSDFAADEDQLGQELFAASGTLKNPKLGYARGTYAGYAIKDDLRSSGSSGGMGTWLATRLLRDNLVDAVIHVKAVSSGTGDNLFEYRVSESVEQARQGSKSRYYPITLAQVIEQVKEQDKRYAFIGIPCFTKAMRLLEREDELLKSRVVAHIGLVCGHLKSRAFAESMAWQMGISPDNLISYDFRKKLDNGKANAYGVEARGIVDGQVKSITSPVRELFGYDWGVGVFKPKSCDFCDDVMAETADITIGDAWLPQYVADDQGTNLVVVRSELFADLLQRGIAEGEVHCDELSAEQAIASQSSGFSHRREGLSYRLWAADQRREWRPQKRVAAAQGIHGDILEKRQQLRMQIAKLSHTAFKQAKDANNIRIYTSTLLPVIEQYRNLTRPPLKRVLAWFRFKLGLTKQ